jgi:hypothetical protein
MKIFVKVMLLLFSVFFWVTNASADTNVTANQKPKKDVEVMILATFHFTGGESDAVNEEIDDFLAPQRQAEINAVLDCLELYAPDKIMLELNNERGGEFNKKYMSYLKGNHKLTVNERQQLGMRLAARLKHKRLYAIDYSNYLDYRPSLAEAKLLEQTDLLREHKAQISAVETKIASQKGRSLSERLISLNSDYSKGNNFFLTLAQMGTVEKAEGALSVLPWWERNLVMFARSAQYSKPGDRILIVVGSAHKSILQQLFEDADGFRVISPVKYLENK